MPQQIVDAMNDAASWTALMADVETPSTEIDIVDDTTRFRFGADAISGRIDATNQASGHLLRRTIPALDLRSFDDLRLWLWSNRVGNGSASQPYYLELRLASQAMGFDHPGNTWSRFLPVSQPNAWEFARLTLADLPSAIRSAVTALQIRCVDASSPFTCNLDDLLAVREEMIGDVDASLRDRLDDRVSLDDGPVPAILYHPEDENQPDMPYIRISNYEIVYAGERTSYTRTQADFSANGVQLRPVSERYDLLYEIDVFVPTRADKTRVQEFVLRSLAPRSELVVNGMPLQVEWIRVPSLDTSGQWRSDRAQLYFKVSTRLETGPSQAAVPVREIAVDVDSKA